MRAIIPILLIAWMVCPSQAGAQDLGGRSLAGLDRLQEGTRFRVSSADSDWRNGNADARPIEPGETLTVADIEGPGRITHIWFTISADDPHYGRSVTLRMYWDGQEEPAVESPLGDFFAVGHGLKRNVNSLPVQVSSEGRAYNCYWPMPFRKSARITVTNDSAEHKVHALFWYVDGVKLPSLPEDTAYFHAQYRQEFPCVGGRNYLIFDGEGAGHYVGTVLSVHMNSASWFGEGDDFFYIDGEQEPSLRGTGTEDYFCDAWGFRELNRPYYGVTVWEGYDIDDHGTAYRWHITDPVPFKKSLLVTIEHKGVTFDKVTVISPTPLNIPVLVEDKDKKDEDDNDPADRYIYMFDGDKIKSGFEERPDHFSSVAFWYQTGQAKRFAKLPPAEERLVAGTRIEGEAVFEFAQAEPKDTLEVQKGGQWSGEQQLFYHPVKSETPPVLKVSFDVTDSARYMVKLNMTHSWDYGIYKIDLDGKNMVPGVDLYSKDLLIKPIKLGAHSLKAGKHTLTFTYVDSNVASRLKGTAIKGTYMGLDSLDLRKLPAYFMQKVKAKPSTPKKAPDKDK